MAPLAAQPTPLPESAQSLDPVPSGYTGMIGAGQVSVVPVTPGAPAAAPDTAAAEAAADGCDRGAGGPLPAARSAVVDSEDPENPERQAADAGTAAADQPTVERMARLRQLVRAKGVEPEAAARELGIDPIIAQLWLRLPDDLWPAPPAGGLASAGGSSPAAGGWDRLAGGAPGAALPPPRAPASGLRRVLTCRVPVPALDRLRAGDTPVIEAAAAALETGLALPRPEVAPGGWRFARRPLAVPVAGAAFAGIVDLAQAAFNGDARDAAGWLIARGLGMALPLPTREELAGPPRLHEGGFSHRLALAGSPVARFVVPPRRRPEPKAPLPPDDSAPSGDELRTRREAIGISQRDLAAASGLSRGLVAEVERGRRRHVLTRLRLSETLASLERNR